MTFFRTIHTCALLCLVAAPALSQQYTVKNLVFDGTTPYSQSSLEAASGLKPGDTITKDDLQAASQRLVDTGAFADLQSSLDGPMKSISVIFKVKPVDPARLLTVNLEDFVWFEPAELTAQLQKLVPLFNGTIPEAGNQQDAVVAALKQLLTAKGVTAGSISVEPVAPSPSQPLRLITFRVDKPDVRIHSVHLEGVMPPFTDPMGKLVAALTGKRYTEGLTPSSITNSLLAAYKNAGYQASSITSLTRTIAASTPTRIDVDVAATIQPGDLYRLSRFDWPGSPMMSKEAFPAEAELHPGDIASQVQLLKSLAKLQAAYRNKGYMDVVVTATPQLDTTAHTVAFTIAAIPGAQYTLSRVTPVNLSDAQRADFDRGWKLHPGDIYDEGYVTSFLKNNTALLSLAGLSASFKTVADPDAHTVDLTMTFAGAGTTGH